MCECKCGGENTDLSLIDAVLDGCGNDAGSLIAILQKAQDIYGYIPRDVMYRVAERTGVSPAKVMGVATFYTQFRLKPVGRYLILLCKGTACHVNGADGIEKAICEHLDIKDGETTKDGMFSLKNVACLGCCSLSPVMMINGTAYGSLTPDKAISVLEGLRAEGATV